MGHHPHIKRFINVFYDKGSSVPIMCLHQRITCSTTGLEKGSSGHSETLPMGQQAVPINSAQTLHGQDQGLLDTLCWWPGVNQLHSSPQTNGQGHYSSPGSACTEICWGEYQQVSSTQYKAAATITALTHAALVVNILNTAGWASAHTFAKFYNKGMKNKCLSSLPGGNKWITGWLHVEVAQDLETV